MAEKRYYWMKLKEDFFTSKRIKRLRNLAGGDTYTIIYLKMQLKALKDDGFLYFDGVMDNFADELALDIDESVDDVKVTVSYLMSVGLLETNDEMAYKLTYMENLIGSESAHTQRQRNYIQRKKAREASLNDANVTQMLRSGDVEKEIEIDIEKDIDTPLTPQKGNDSSFDAFWNAYPKKVGKQDAKKAFKNVKVPLDTLLTAIEQQKRGSQWTRDNGQYIPNPATWLRQGRWDDEVYAAPKTKSERRLTTDQDYERSKDIFGN